MVYSRLYHLLNIKMSRDSRLILGGTLELENIFNAIIRHTNYNDWHIHITPKNYSASNTNALTSMDCLSGALDGLVGSTNAE